MEGVVSWMKHSKQHLRLHFLRCLLMADFGQVLKLLLGYQKGFSVTVSAVSGWKYLKRLGWTLQTPRPQHQTSAAPEAQQAFKKTKSARRCP